MTQKDSGHDNFRWICTSPEPQGNIPDAFSVPAVSVRLTSQSHLSILSDRQTGYLPSKGDIHVVDTRIESFGKILAECMANSLLRLLAMAIFLMCLLCKSEEPRLILSSISFRLRRMSCYPDTHETLWNGQSRLRCQLYVGFVLGSGRSVLVSKGSC
jgi:hypothetical protein